MHLVKLLIALLVAVPVACGAYVVILFSGERPYTIYESYSEIVEDGAIERGWIPLWFPKAATEIHEVHDLDTNVMASSFSLPDGYPLELPSNCKSSRFASPPRIRTKLMSRSVHRENEFYSCPGLFVAKADDGTIHIWSK